MRKFKLQNPEEFESFWQQLFFSFAWRLLSNLGMIRISQFCLEKLSCKQYWYYLFPGVFNITMLKFLLGHDLYYISFLTLYLGKFLVSLENISD